MIEKYILNAIIGKSKLTQEILEIEGMSSPANRHLLNNIMSERGVRYLEIGVYRGATFVSALYGNDVDATAIDDWSEFGAGSPSLFFDNCLKFGLRDIRFINKNAFEVNLDNIKKKINVYFYDARHSTEATAQSLTYYYPVLADELLYIVDDFDWEEVREGTYSGIKECDFTVADKWILEANFLGNEKFWWNGLGIFKLKK